MPPINHRFVYPESTPPRFLDGFVVKIPQILPVDRAEFTFPILTGERVGFKYVVFCIEVLCPR